MKLIEYRVFNGIVTRRCQLHINVWRITLGIAWLAKYHGPLKWFVWCGKYKGILACRWARCVWFHRLGLGVSIDSMPLSCY
jgi:hypothetical protein